MSQNNQGLVSNLMEKIPEPMKLKASEWKAQFLAAKKSTQYAIGAASVLLLVVLFSMGDGSSDSITNITYEARRGDLDITVLEGGALEALQSQEIRSRIKGREGVKILNIVEEGYQVTPEDVEQGLVLVELDKSQLIDQQLNQDIAVESAEATYIERKAQYEIQLNQNMTDLNDARQDMRFARLDFEKFLGGNIVGEIIAKLEIEERLARAEEADRLALINRSAPPLREVSVAANSSGGLSEEELSAMPAPMQDRIRQMMAENGGELPAEMLDRMRSFSQGGGFPPGGGRPDTGQRGGSGAPESGSAKDGFAQSDEPDELVLNEIRPQGLQTTATLLMDASYMEIRDELDFTQYASIEILEDGEAKQELRSLLDDLSVSQEELLLAQDRIAGQRRLEERGFITPTELEAEELNLNKASNSEEEKETGLKLYIQYSFPKEAEQMLSDFENAVMGYQRQLKENVAEQAQEEARFSSAERKFNLEQVKLADLNEQLELATIRAERPGLVVYGGANQNSMRYGGSNQEAIQEGATIRERQSILTIPDLREMAIKVNIHESAVQRVAVGQAVNVTIDAFPDQALTGRVTKVAVVADSANAFMNPDLKVYPTTITIDGTHDWLRPGMSSEVEILVNRLRDVVYVPIQAVTYFDDKRVVYVDRGGRPERREVQVGRFSEAYIEITAGLTEGEDVLLLPPQQSLADASS